MSTARRRRNHATSEEIDRAVWRGLLFSARVKETGWGAAPPSDECLLLMLRADCCKMSTTLVRRYPGSGLSLPTLHAVRYNGPGVLALEKNCRMMLDKEITYSNRSAHRNHYSAFY